LSLTIQLLSSQADVCRLLSERKYPKNSTKGIKCRGEWIHEYTACLLMIYFQGFWWALRNLIGLIFYLIFFHSTATYS
jgi:hypothetical protein